MQKEIMKYLYIFIICCLIFLPFPIPAVEITGSYNDISPHEITFTLTVDHSEPGGIIIEHHSPAGSINATTPSATKIDQSSGVVKWLLRNPESAPLTFRLEFNQPVSRSQLYFILRYRNQGTFIEKTIKP